MTLDKQFDLLATFLKQVVIKDGLVYEDKLSPNSGALFYISLIEEITFQNNVLHINGASIFELYLTEVEAMKAAYDRLSKNVDEHNIYEVLLYNQYCPKFQLPQIDIDKTSYRVNYLKKDLERETDLLNRVTDKIKHLKATLNDIGVPV